MFWAGPKSLLPPELYALSPAAIVFANGGLVPKKNRFTVPSFGNLSKAGALVLP